MAGAQGVVITTDVPIAGRAAVPCYVDETLPIVGPSRAVTVVTTGPLAGGPPMAVRLAPAGTPAIGPALPIYIVSGILDVQAYTNKVKAVAPANLIAYWPLAESSGTVINDVSGNARNGVYTSVTLGAAGIGDGRTAATWDGTTSQGNIYSAGLAGAFSGAEGTIALWCKVSGAGVWTDGANRYLFYLAVDANNEASIFKSSVNGRIRLFYNAAATTDEVPVNGLTSTDWQHFALTWSKSNEIVRGYLNGTQVSTSATLGIWAGAIATTRAVLGASTLTPTLVWSGSLAHAGLWSTPLSAAQVAQLATVAS